MRPGTRLNRTLGWMPAVLWGLLPVGCGTPLQELPSDPAPARDLCCTRAPEALTIQYLGVGGWLFRMGDASVLTAPFFSHPGALEVGFWRIGTDTARVDRWLPAVEDVPAILVGHAHYDHLMDVPYIARAKAPAARIYGSRTAVNLLMGAPYLDADRLVEVESRAGNDERPGEWIGLPGGRIRFMALESGHADHFRGIHLYRGEQEEPADSLPEFARGWVEGRPLAYLIDFLDPEGDVAFRIHYQDAASSPPLGFPPPLPDRIPVDLAILCPPGFDQLQDYPEGILRRLEPRFAFLGHWENFLGPPSEEWRTIPGLDLEEFIRRMEAVLPEGATWQLPEPGERIRVGPGR